jgi:release factor glutamine methyltransferase
MSETWTVGRVVAWATDDFKTRGLETPRLDAELLLGQAIGIERLRILIEPERPLSADELSKYRELIKRRRAREPLAYLRGDREFYGRPFLVTKDVLIPRPDTETLVEVALARTKARYAYGRALDLCTGSGCVAITFAKERPQWRVTATDVSEAALAVARKNAERLGLVWNFRMIRGDLFAPIADERFELITANPPYIPDAEVETLQPEVRVFEPRLALAGGVDGLDLVRRIVNEAPAHLVAGGTLAMEIMAGTGAEVMALFEAGGFTDVALARDYAGRDRVVSGAAK